jgi:hypothetical protein
MKDPDRYYANLDFSDFETNATWAAKVYDNPDPNRLCGGDGVPDFKGPPPPPSPMLNFHTERGKVKIRWSGKATERTRDSFNGRLDFEGYRLYMSRTGLSDDYALLGSYDKIDYKFYRLNRAKADRPWDWKAASVSSDSLKSWLEGKGMEPLGKDPLVWTKSIPFVISPFEQTFYIRLSDSLLDNGRVAVAYDSIKLAPGDSLYFEAQDWNVGLDSIAVNRAYRDSVDKGWIHPDVIDPKYWDYEYEIGVFAGEPSYFAVTASDVGDPQTGLSSLEASKLVNATLVYPFDSWEKVKEKGLKVAVFPNPYRIDGNYFRDGYEPGQRNFDRRLRFVNLPPRCTIRIYTLDGDLVRTLDHDKQEEALDATYHYWDLITRNTQAVVSGIYLFSVEDRKTGEIQLGKFVIIK